MKSGVVKKDSLDPVEFGRGGLSGTGWRPLLYCTLLYWVNSSIDYILCRSTFPGEYILQFLVLRDKILIVKSLFIIV